METRTLELVVEELADLPDVGLIEVLDFVRFRKSQLKRMNPKNDSTAPGSLHVALLPKLQR